MAPLLLTSLSEKNELQGELRFRRIFSVLIIFLLELLDCSANPVRLNCSKSFLIFEFFQLCFYNKIVCYFHFLLPPRHFDTRLNSHFFQHSAKISSYIRTDRAIRIIFFRKNINGFFKDSVAFSREKIMSSEYCAVFLLIVQSR
jgi:hypothetical protein